MKTKAMKHQVEGCKRLRANFDFYALGCEQGTGKTWMILADAEWWFCCHHKRLDAILIIAPNGVHTNWVRNQIPEHLEAKHIAAHWVSGASQKHQRYMNRVLKGDPERDGLLIFAMNVDAVNWSKGYAVAERFLKEYRVMLVIDESQKIKNPSAKRTQKIITLGGLAHSRRIASGTLVANAPDDLFSQYEFLRHGLLGTTSYRAFVAEFAEVLPPNHPLVQHIRENNPKIRGNPQVIKRDAAGQPVYRNLAKLSRLMAPYTYRVTKAECLDLPPKIYQTHYFTLEPEQRKLYNAVKTDRRWEREDGSIDMFIALTVITKLQQITSGFIMIDSEAARLAHSGARMKALLELIEDIEGQVIVWARFRDEIDQIATALCKRGVVAQYHGGVGPTGREAAVEQFQDGTVRYFIANPATAGVGLTLTAARTVIYYSNSYNMEERVQSEDRAHRIGTHEPVVYIDLVAEDTIDERIAASLQSKQLVADEIMRAL